MLTVVLLIGICAVVGAFYLATFWACTKAEGWRSDLLAAVLGLGSLGYFWVVTIWVPTPGAWARDAGLLTSTGEAVGFAVATLGLAGAGAVLLAKLGYVARVSRALKDAGR